MSDQSTTSRGTSIAISMFAFFLIFSTVGGIIELLSEGPDGEQSYALFSASASTIIFGLVVANLATRLPAKWWGESIVFGVIFYLIWLLMSAVGGGLDSEAFVSGAIYAVIGALIAGIFYEIFSRADRR